MHTTQKQKLHKQPNFKTGKTPNKHFSKEDTQMAKKCIKTCSMQLFIKKVQIKTTVRYQLTPVRMTITPKSKDSKSWRRCGGKGGLIQLRGAATTEKSTEALRTIKNRTTLSQRNQAVPPLGRSQRKWNQRLKETSAFPSSWQHYLEYLRHGVKPNVYWRMDGLKSV